MNRAAIIAFCILVSMINSSYGNPITMNFSGKVLDSYSTPSWVGLPLSGSFTIYPENFTNEFSYLSSTSSHVYTYLGPAYGRYGNPILDYSITLPDASVYKAPHQDAYAEWGGVFVHHQYLDGPSQETYQVGLQIQPLDRSYQVNFSFILENELHDGALVSSADIDQTPNLNGVTYESAYLDVFDYRNMTSRLNVRFSVDSLERLEIPEPASRILVLIAAVGLLVTRRRDSHRKQGKAQGSLT